MAIETESKASAAEMLTEEEISSCLQSGPQCEEQETITENRVAKEVSGSRDTKSKRRCSAPPPRRSRSTRCPRQRWSHPVRSHRNSSARGEPETILKKEPQILDPSLASAVPPTGLDVDPNSLPRPPCSQSWDWPLTRHEKKARILMIDKNVLLMDRETLQNEIEVLRDLETTWGVDS
jgi:hypothetical protein